MAASNPLRPSGTADRSLNGNGIRTTDLKLSPAHHHVWLVTGPAGCGKTTVAQHVAKELSLPYVEGDDVSFSLQPPPPPGFSTTRPVPPFPLPFSQHF